MNFLCTLSKTICILYKYIYIFFFKILFEGDSIDLLCRAVGTDALEGVILTWNTSALNNSGSIIVSDGDFKNTGLIQT